MADRQCRSNLQVVSNKAGSQTANDHSRPLLRCLCQRLKQTATYDIPFRFVPGGIRWANILALDGSTRKSRTPQLRALFVRFRAQTPTPPDIKQLPTVKISIDSRRIAEITASGGSIDQTWAVHADPARLWSVLSIETDQSFSPSNTGASSDNRELGIRRFSIDWYPAPGTGSLITSADQFLGSGWYLLERDATDTWRWTSDRATLNLPSIDSDGQLTLTMLVPERSPGIRSDVTIEIAGEKIDHFNPPAGFFTRQYKVPARLISSRTELKLSTTGIVLPPDARTLGIRVLEIDWKPAP